MAPPLAHRRSPGDQRAAPSLLLRLLATTTIRLLRLPTPPTSLSRRRGRKSHPDGRGVR